MTTPGGDEAIGAGIDARVQALLPSLGTDLTPVQRELVQKTVFATLPPAQDEAA